MISMKEGLSCAAGRPDSKEGWQRNSLRALARHKPCSWRRMALISSPLSSADMCSAPCSQGVCEETAHKATSEANALALLNQERPILPTAAESQNHIDIINPCPRKRTTIQKGRKSNLYSNPHFTELLFFEQKLLILCKLRLSIVPSFVLFCFVECGSGSCCEGTLYMRLAFKPADSE